MRFVEIEIFGVYIAPIAAMLIAAWATTLLLRKVADRLNLMHFVWHPPLFIGAIFLIILSSIVLFAAR